MSALSLEKVLVVDDLGDEVFDVADYSMRQLGAKQILKALTSEEGLALIVNERPDLVILDQHFPTGLSGWDMAVKAYESWKGFKAVFFTGYADDVNTRDAPRWLHGVIAKPLGFSDLAERVKRCMEQSNDDADQRVSASQFIDTHSDKYLELFQSVERHTQMAMIVNWLDGVPPNLAEASFKKRSLNEIEELRVGLCELCAT